MGSQSNVVRLDDSVRDYMREQSRIDRARRENREVALELVKAGIPILFVSGETKRPITSAHEQIDSDIAPEEREAKRRKFFDDHGFDPLVIGATTNRTVVREVLRRKPDALPAISCGPSGLIVIDNDIKERNGVMRNGVELFDAFVERQGKLPEGIVAVQSQGGGRHLYFSNPDKMGCSAGTLKADCESDVKGRGGYVVAPGTTRIADGKKYGRRADTNALIQAFKSGTLPLMPPFIRDAIGTRASEHDDEGHSVSEREIKALADAVKREELPDAAKLLNPALGGFDMPVIEKRYPAFGEAIGRGNLSDIMYNLAGALKAERRNVTLAEYAAVLFEREDCGEFVGDDTAVSGESYNWRSVVRAFERAKPAISKPSDGEQFSPVDDETEAVDSAEIKEDKRAKLKAEMAALDAAIEELGNAAALDEPGAAESLQALERLRKRAAKEFAKLEEVSDRQSKLDTGFMWGATLCAEYQPADDLIEGWLPASGVVVLQGESNSGKTFAAIEMLDCVSRGAKFLERNVVQGGAMLIAGEGHEGLKKRFTALYRERPCEGRGIAVRADLPDFSDAKAAARYLEGVACRYQDIQGAPLRLLVMDNLLKLIGGEDLHHAKSVGPMFTELGRVARERGLCMVVLHHFNKSGTAAGTFAIRAHADSTINLTVDNGVRTLKFDKERDGPADERLRFKLRSVKLGVNRWGNEVTSCVVEAYSPMEAVVDDEAPTIRPLDRREDRIQDVVEVFEAEARRQKASDETLTSVRGRLELQSGEIERAVNAHRKASGLEVLKRTTVMGYLKAAVDADRLEVAGTKGRPAYRLK